MEKPKIWHSLAYRLLLSLALYSLLLVGVISYINTELVERTYKSEVEEMIRERVIRLEPLINQGIAKRDSKQLQSALDALKTANFIEGAALDLGAINIYLRSQEDMSLDPFVIVREELTDRDGKTVGSLRVNASDQMYQKMMQSYLQYLGMLAVGYLLLSYILLRVLSRSFLPLGELTRQLENFDPSDPAPIVIDHMGNNEISMIADAANKMRDNIAHHAGYMQELASRLEESRQHLKEAQQIARMGSWRYDTQSGECEFSDQMYALMGLEDGDMKLDWEDFIEAVEVKDRRFFERAVQNTAKTHVPFRLLHELRTRHGEVLHILTEGKRSEAKEGEIVVTGISMDVSEQTESQRMIEKLAFYDPLTNLPNRTLLNDRLNKAIMDARRRGEKVGVFFLDLDRFKHINDTMGHTFGDLLLKEVAQRLKKSLRETDTVSRIGGDEFIIIATMQTEIKDVELVGKKVLRAMQARFELGHKSLFTTTSIGVAVYPDHAGDAEKLMKYADTAMYKAKEAGRNGLRLYSPQMGEQVEQRIQLEHDMREALATMEQFELYYQAKVSLRTGAIIGAEVLIRWNHPKHGLVFPDTFIPLAESTGMIIPIGEWVMHESARTIEQWQRVGVPPARLAVNLSGTQFQSPTLLQQIRNVLEQHQISPDLLEFEVTESVSMVSLSDSLKVLNELKALGVGVVIDDFGTGYSSLAYLKQFPVDTLKIDKAFIMNMLEDQDDRTIVEAIVSMSKAMNLRIVAEGIEAIEHVKLLQKLKVDYGQGYFFSKPIPFEKFNKLYKHSLAKMRAREAKQMGF